MDILEALDDLHKQATTERSHYYVAKVVKESAQAIVMLRARVKILENELKRRAGRD